MTDTIDIKPKRGRKPWATRRYIFNTTDDRAQKVEYILGVLLARDSRATLTDVMNAAIDALHERMAPISTE